MFMLADFHEIMEKHWDHFIHAQGDYFKGDSGNWELWYAILILWENSLSFWITPHMFISLSNLIFYISIVYTICKQQTLSKTCLRLYYYRVYNNYY